jgi:PAS domain S-box-containing protein
MGEMLRREGYESVEAQDFDSALSLIESNHLDAAVVDIVLPRKSGLELLSEISSRQSYLPVIVITGEPNLAQIPELVRAGAYDYIAKPVRKEKLLSTIAKAVEKKRLIDEKLRLEEEIKKYTERLESLVVERTGELARAHNFLNTLLNSSTEYAIVSIDGNGLVTLFNRGAELLFGYKESEMLGQSIFRLYATPEAGASGYPEWAQTAQAEGRHQSEIELRNGTGNPFIASLTATPIQQYPEQPLGCLAIIKDLTVERWQEEELRQMQARLAHNEKIASLGRIAAQVAHEVKNPLTGLRLYSLHLKDKAASEISPASASLLDKIIDGINHLSSTVERVLNFARPLTLIRRRVGLNQIVTDAIQLLEPQMAANRIECELKLCGEESEVAVDEPLIRSTLINLMLNSIQAMSGSGKLTITTEVIGESINLRVSDTGRGMTEEQLRQAFEPFYTTRSQGLGLGLPYAKRVIEEHGGQLELDSTPGSGVTAKINLPLEEEKANGIKRQSARH